MTAPEHDEVGKCREVTLDALNESVSLVIGMVLQHTADEAKRKAVIEVLIACHKAALAGFAPERPRLH
jgi:hypothetical protein